MGIMRARYLTILVGAVALIVSPLFAQIHGVPASATSLGPNGFTGGSGFIGIPAGATSLGPNGFTGNGVVFDRGNVFFNRVDGRLLRSQRLGLHAQPFFAPLMFSPFYYATNSLPVDAMSPDPYSQGRQAEQIPSKLEITIVDKRSDGVRPDPNPDPAASAPPATSQVAEELTTKVLVMRDGSKKEIRNYAILGKNLFDLSDGRSRRIPLEDVDVAATTKVNEENGVDFKLP